MRGLKNGALKMVMHGSAWNETPTTMMDRLLTPTSAFFVRSHHGSPELDRQRPLTVDGLVAKPAVFTAEDLKKRFREVTITAALQCAGNGRAFHSPSVPGIQWTHGAMGQATFTGVRLRDVLRSAAPSREASHVHLLGADAPSDDPGGPANPANPANPAAEAYLRSLPLDRALDPTTLIAYRMNGEDLTLDHGAPLRLIVPGWSGNHWVKWLTKLTLATKEADGFYMTNAYRLGTTPATTFPIKSIIASPSDGARVGRGTQQEVVGVALSGEAAITRVEVSLDDGTTWNEAELEGDSAPGRWNVFRFSFNREKPCTLRAVARATDANGNIQPEQAAWNPAGYFFNAQHAVTFEIE
jgi:sulfite oxidase